MRKLEYLRRALFGSMLGAVLALGSAFSVNAQSETREYREWQQARERAAREQQDYLRTRSPRDYQQWQNAERVAQEQYRQYQAASSRYGSNYNYRDNNYRNDNYNDRYNNRNYDRDYRNNNNGMIRINRNGVYYTTDSRGAELLRTAVRNGYSQGYQQGQMDRRGRRQFDYTMGQMYRNGTYGYQSYVARDQYQYYFQQGFQRGYEDGYNSTYRYGSRNGNGFNILGNVLDAIINISH